MYLRKDLPLITSIIKAGGRYGFKIPKALVDINYFKEGKEYRIFFEEIEK